MDTIRNRDMSIPDTGLDPLAQPDITIDAAKVFGIQTKMQVPAFKKASDCSPREYREIHKNANHEFTFSGRIVN